MPTELPETAKTKTAKQLCGVTPYDFKDGKSNGPDWTPEWIEDPTTPEHKDKGGLKLNVFVIVGISLMVGYWEFGWHGNITSTK
jgi:hypothetical protein